MLSLRRFAVSVYKYILLYILRFFKFYLNDMPIPEPNSVSHNLSFCERQYCRRIWGRERQNQLTGDHWNKLAHHSDKNGKGLGTRTPTDAFGERNATITPVPYMEEETRFELAEVLPSPPFQDGALNHSATLPFGVKERTWTAGLRSHNPTL